LKHLSKFVKKSKHIIEDLCTEAEVKPLNEDKEEEKHFIHKGEDIKGVKKISNRELKRRKK
jgi:hypothetical protein